MAHVLVHAGLDPTFLVGGVTLNYGGNFRIGRGQHVVVEGDEYDTAYFDKGPKFLHYRARSALLTSIEFDHADIFTRPRALRVGVREILCHASPGRLARRKRVVSARPWRSPVSIAPQTSSRMRTADDADYRAIEVSFGAEGARFRHHGSAGRDAASCCCRCRDTTTSRTRWASSPLHAHSA